MRIFFVSQRVPYPPDRGDKITTFAEVKHLSRKHEVHIFCLADGREDLKNCDPLREVVAGVFAVPVDPMRARFRALRALFTGEPLSVAMLAEPKLHREIRSGFERLRPDLILVYSSNVAQFAEPFSETPRIMQIGELDSHKWRAYAERFGIPMRWVYRLEGKRLFNYERRITGSFSHSLVCTEAEAADFHRLLPRVPLTIVGNGVDLTYFAPAGRPKVPGRMAFTGVMDYAPNVDAVAWFCTEILPRIRREVPEAGLTICGSRPSREVMRLGRLPGVTVTGRVPDVRPYLDEAEVFVCPLRIARGIQNKVLEAMAMGLPVVSSTPAWRGTAIPPGNGILVADEPELFAAEVVRLLRDPAFRSEMGMGAHAAVADKFSWERQLATLDSVVEKLGVSASQ